MQRFPFAHTRQDYILEAWIEYLESLNYKGHLSLHYDGIRINSAATENIDEFCQNCSDYIFKHTDFRVKILEKKHHNFRQLIKLNATSRVDAHLLHECLLLPGNCIPATLSRFVKPPTNI